MAADTPVLWCIFTPHDQYRYCVFSSPQHTDTVLPPLPQPPWGGGGERGARLGTGIFPPSPFQHSLTSLPAVSLTPRAALKLA